MLVSHTFSVSNDLEPFPTTVGGLCCVEHYPSYPTARTLYYRPIINLKITYAVYATRYKQQHKHSHTYTPKRFHNISFIAYFTHYTVSSAFANTALIVESHDAVRPTGAGASLLSLRMRLRILGIT